MDTLDTAGLLGLLGPQLTPEQATLIFQQGQEAVVFALLTLAKQLGEKQTTPSATIDPSTPSGQIPPYAKPAANHRAKPKGARPGHPGHCRPTPTRVDRHETHTLETCPKCHGPVRPCRSSRTRVIEDIPADITPVVTEHTIPRYWCPECHTTVEPTVPDALPGSTVGLRVVVLSAWLHYLLGTTLAQIIDVFNFHLQFKLSSGGLIQMWRRLREILLAWYIEIQTQALASAVLHVDRLRDLLAQPWEQHHARRVVKRLKRHATELFTFLDHPEVPFDNNHVEHQIRPAVIVRKNSDANGSKDGAETQSILMSVFRTLKQRGHDPVSTVIEAIRAYLRTGQLPPLPARIAENG